MRVISTGDGPLTLMAERDNGRRVVPLGFSYYPTWEIDMTFKLV